MPGSNSCGQAALVYTDGFTRDAIHKCCEAHPLGVPMRFSWEKEKYDGSEFINLLFDLQTESLLYLMVSNSLG